MSACQHGYTRRNQSCDDQELADCEALFVAVLVTNLLLH